MTPLQRARRRDLIRLRKILEQIRESESAPKPEKLPDHTTAIVAGSYHQYRNYLSDYNISPHDRSHCYIGCITDLHRLDGLARFQIIYIGTWWESNVWRRGKEVLRYYERLSEIRIENDRSRSENTPLDNV